MATRLADACTPGSDHRKAVLLVGKAPGLQEDRYGKAFSGPTGLITNKLYIERTGLHRYADVFLTNAVRCKLPNSKMAVPLSGIRNCRVHLEADLRDLDAAYDEVVVLATGAEAISSILGRKTGMGKVVQGQLVELGGKPRRVFCTFLAEYIRQDPAKVEPVLDHLLTVRDYLRDGNLPFEVSVPTADRTSRIPPTTALVSFDIETYGYVETFPPQRFFHPAKSIKWDGVPADSLVVCAAAAWRHPETGELCHRVYDLTDTNERRQLADDLLGLRSPVILGQNLPFDILYMRAWGPEFRSIFDWFRFPIVDLAVVNFLDSDQRPERSLKNLSPLLKIASFEDEEVDIKKGQRYPSPTDPRLHAYCAKDTLATLRCYEVLTARFVDKFGPETTKWNTDSRGWFSDLLWASIYLSEVGIRYDSGELRRRLQIATRQLATMDRRGRDRFGHVYSGKGSGKWKREFGIRCCDGLGLRDDPRLKLTDKKKEISADKENLNLFLAVAPVRSQLRTEVVWLKHWTRLRDLVSRYLNPMCGVLGKGKKAVRDQNASLVDGFAYPSWFPVPSQSSQSDETGGTQQARITAKGPAVQTVPPVVEDCEVSRFTGGVRVSIDESQIELRVPAGLSFDTEMINEFQPGKSLHRSTASLFAGFAVDKDRHPKEYHAGKSMNFLRIFHGGAKKGQETVRKEAGLEVPLATVEAFLAADLLRYPTFYDWQDGLVDRAVRRGFIELPPFGYHRSFWGPEPAVRGAYVPTICNFPVQSYAALLVLSAQIDALKWILRSGLPVVFCKNTYDEGVYDMPGDLVSTVVPTLVEFYRKPSLYARLVGDGIMAPVPLDVEAKIGKTKWKGG